MLQIMQKNQFFIFRKRKINLKITEGLFYIDI